MAGNPQIPRHKIQIEKIQLTVSIEFDAIFLIFHSTVPLVHGQGRPVCRSPTAFSRFRLSDNNFEISQTEKNPN